MSFFRLLRPRPRSPLFPYTTLFRSLLGRVLRERREAIAIATKVGPRDDPRTSLEASLRRLGSERSEEHTSELQSHSDLVCRLLLEKKKIHNLSHRNVRCTTEPTVIR